MRATHLVCLAGLGEVLLNTMGCRYVLKIHFFIVTGSNSLIYGCVVLQIEKIDIVTADMGHALATEGGFCTGSSRVVDHQVRKYVSDNLIILLNFD